MLRDTGLLCISGVVDLFSAVSSLLLQLVQLTYKQKNVTGVEMEMQCVHSLIHP